jgi:hypothetical protein
MGKTIYDYIIEEENTYQTRPVPIVDGYEWNMFDHIKKTTLYKNSQYVNGDTDLKPFKNIIRPILNVAYRSEGFDVKNIVPFVNSAKDYYKSFIVKHYHQKWARENDIDSFIDELVEAYVDYGGALVKNINTIKPEVVPFQRIAFVDQTDILAGVICEKHMYTPDQLLTMKWDKDKIEEAITMAEAEKPNTQTGTDAKTPGKYIAVYELHGSMPSAWLNDDEQNNEYSYTNQAQYVTFYESTDGKKNGITLFSNKEKEPLYKMIIRDKIYGRALGFGGVEELFQPQIWTNYSIIQLKEMLDVASMMMLQTADTSFETRNKITEMEKGVHEDGKPISQIVFQPQNIQAFENAVVEWETHARTTGSANDAQLGVSPDSGTPFALQNLIVGQGQGLHEWRKGKIATFMAEIYRDWVLSYFIREMNKGQEWLSELTLDEMQVVAQSIVESETRDMVYKATISGRILTDQDIEQFKQDVKDSFMRSGSKKFIKALEGELQDIDIDVEMNIAGKQNDLAGLSAKLSNIFQQVIANPQSLSDPRAAKIFNDLLESSGLSPVDFGSMALPAQTAQTTPIAPEQQGIPSPIQPALQPNQ